MPVQVQEQWERASASAGAVGAGAADMSCGDHGDVSGGRGRQGGLEGGVGGGDGAAK
jgi:hypothetical protein